MRGSSRMAAAGPSRDDAAALEQDEAVHHLDGRAHVLLDQQDGEARPAPARASSAAPRHQARRKADRGLVEQQHARARRAARGRSPASAARRPTARSPRGCGVPAGAGTGRRPPRRVAAPPGCPRRGAGGGEIVVHRHAAEDPRRPPAPARAPRDARVRRQRADVLAVQQHAARDVGRAARPAGDRVDQRRLARAVGADDADQLARRDGRGVDARRARLPP